MDRLPHGYTNKTRLENGRVIKRYEGSGAQERCLTEQQCLRAFSGRLPVPRVLSDRENELTMEHLDGRHGQELVDEGKAEAVLHAAGRVLWRIHEMPKHLVQLAGTGKVVVHGDFGPQNLLLSEQGDHVSGVLDWEWAHYGDPVEDLAWAEWIVRMHHPGSEASLPALFKGYGSRPPWPDRHGHMVRRCEELAASDPIQRGALSPARLWRDRSSFVRKWAPLPDDER